MTIRAYIGVGSNLCDPVVKAKNGIKAIAALPQVVSIKASSLYSSRPMGPQSQPDYVNAVVAIETTLSCRELLIVLQAIELNYGRVRKEERWGARTLDLDILLFGHEVINEPDLIVPHYGMKQREFVLLPLFELSPSLVLPDGSELSRLVGEIDRNGLQVIENLPQNLN